MTANLEKLSSGHRTGKGQFSFLWPLLSFSKFAVILSAALSQHHLSGFEIALLEFPHLY